MNQLQLFLPCAAGFEDYLAPEILQITGLPPGCITKQRGGVAVRTSLSDAMRLNLSLRTGHRVLLELAKFKAPDPYALGEELSRLPWEELIPANGHLTIDS